MKSHITLFLDSRLHFCSSHVSHCDRKLKYGEMVIGEKKMKISVATAFNVQLWRAMEAEITTLQRKMQNWVSGLRSEVVEKSLVQRTAEGKEKIAFPGYCVLWRWIAGWDKWVQTRTHWLSEHLLRGNSFPVLQSWARVCKTGKELVNTNSNN